MSIQNAPIKSFTGHGGLSPRRFGFPEPKAVWILASFGDQSTDTFTVIHPSPFSVGRKVGCSLQLPSKTVSGNHANLSIEDGKLTVSDLDSTNGTYVNGRRLTAPCVLNEGDMIQFADFAFRVKCDTVSTSMNTVCHDICDQALALVQFDRLMENRLVTPHFQPIVQLNDLKPVGYEVLARSRMFGLETSAALFGAANKLSMEVELSEMLRWEGIREGLQLPQPTAIYVNTHPLELSRPGLVESMRKVRELSSDLEIVLEIHEAAITGAAEMSALRSQLRELSIKLAYDDFGAGQNRLSELCAAPPDVLKYDMSLIRDIDKASHDRVKLLRTLVHIALDMGITPLAEGIETESEAKVCQELGFTLVQGYYFGRPSPACKYVPS